MADMIEPKRTGKGGISNPNIEEIVEDIENHARIVQESGRVEDAANLRDWARELRQKNLKNPF